MFKGYTLGLEDKPHDYDTVEERYQKVKHVCTKFVAFQIGLCTFKWDDSVRKYTMRPFSFYVFPRSQIQDKTMLFQVSKLANNLLQANAIQFLVAQNFDFNKVVSKGISFTPLYSSQDYLCQ
jgi:poly(A)-specific ribonuclease